MFRLSRSMLLLLIAFCLMPILSGCGGFFGPRAKPGVTLAGERVGNYTEYHLRRRIKVLALFVDRPARPAALSPRTWELIPGQAGRRLMVEPTVRAVLRAQAGARLQPIVQEIAPPRRRPALPREIGRYQTPILDAKPPRLYNLTIATRAVDGRNISPGQIFSLNSIIDTEEMRGRYRKAPVIGDDGGMRLEPGGGVCQLATTLYNAALAAGLPVIEVHRHSQPVSYVPPGRDATVYTDKDLRFRNDRGAGIKIRAAVKGKSVVVWLLMKT